MRTRSIGFVASLFLLAVVNSTLQGGDWPMYRADAARSGYSSDPLADHLALQWTYRHPTAPAPAWPHSSRITFDFACQPIIVGQTVIFGSSADDKVVAIDSQSGNVLWTFFTGGPVRFAPVAWRDRVVVASDDGTLYGLSLKDGTLLWRHRGGPNNRMCLGNERMISRWPARGGPVVIHDTVYYTAGIWPSDGIYLHALDMHTGKLLWTNDQAGGLYLPQPHPGANAHSGVAPQGYLLATEERLFVPTGRAVPAALRRSDGQFEYYRLQQNGSIGGARAVIADRFVINGGCFLERDTGNLEARAGRGVLGTLPNGILQLTGKTLLAYRWEDLAEPNKKGEIVQYRGLQKFREITLEDESAERQHAEKVIKKVPVLKDLYRTEIRFRHVDDSIPKQTGLERLLSQARPDIEALNYSTGAFLAARYERQYEVIGAAGEAVCGGPGNVRVVNLDEGRIRWSYEVQGHALGLATANGQLVVSTSTGAVYCFGAALGDRAPAPTNPICPKPLPVISNNIDYGAAVEEILHKSEITTGICIDLGCGTGELALELLRQSELYVIGIDSDPVKVQRARQRLDEAGVYGKRVSIHCGDPCKTPYPRNTANLIVSARGLSVDTAVMDQAEAERLQRPYGGIVCVGKPGQLQVRRRGPLQGAGQWTHQNCNAANTVCSTDEVVRGPLEMAWYRDEALEIVDRHAQGPTPLFSRGFLVVEGVDGICALDAYNGRTVWTYPIEGILADWDGVHHDVGVGDTGSNVCLSDDAVFVRTGDLCLKIDLATGKRLRTFRTPVDASARDRAWGYIAYVDGLLYGSVVNDAHWISPRYWGIRLRNESNLFFAMDADTGVLKWQYSPTDSVRNNAIAVAGKRVYLIDRPLPLADRIIDPKPNGKHRSPLQADAQPGGTLVAMDAGTGSILWKSDDRIFGTQLAVSEGHGVLLMYYQGVKHGFFKLPSEIGGRMAAFDINTGLRLWDKKATYRTRPLINNDIIYAEGGALQLKTGEPVPWNFSRSYGCGQIAGSVHLMVYRSATLGYHDLMRNVGTENFGGIRPGCWFNAVPAGGMVLVPDGSSKCACSYQMRSWLALQPQL